MTNVCFLTAIYCKLTIIKRDHQKIKILNKIGYISSYMSDEAQFRLPYFIVQPRTKISVTDIYLIGKNSESSDRICENTLIGKKVYIYENKDTLTDRPGSYMSYVICVNKPSLFNFRPFSQGPRTST